MTMRHFLKTILYFELRWLSVRILKKYHPKIVAITGSVGKTTAKEAIFKVLSFAYNVRKNPKNYNNEIGVPLTIIGELSPGASLLGWLRVFSKSLLLIFFRSSRYPDILVLEMGADRVGDIEYFTGFVQPSVSVITVVSEAHTEFLGTLEDIAKEKSKLITCLRNGDTAVLNHDDERIMNMRSLTRSRIVTFGLSPAADFYAADIHMVFNEEKGISVTIHSNEDSREMFFENVMAPYLLYSVLAAFCVGEIFDLTFHEIAESLQGFTSPAGRMRLIPGIKSTFIIDDTYNASPLSCVQAVKTLGGVSFGESSSKKYAVLGDMKELGSFSETSHREVGKTVFKHGIDYLFAVGELARDYARGAREAGMSEDRIFNFSDAPSAGRFLQQRIKSGDVILVKGSQDARMERVVKEIMAEPLKAPELLVRQEKEWLSPRENRK